MNVDPSGRLSLKRMLVVGAIVVSMAAITLGVSLAYLNRLRSFRSLEWRKLIIITTVASIGGVKVEWSEIGQRIFLETGIEVTVVAKTPDTYEAYTRHVVVKTEDLPGNELGRSKTHGWLFGNISLGHVSYDNAKISETANPGVAEGVDTDAQDRRRKTFVYNIIMHELGHALTANHTSLEFNAEAADSLMYPYPQDALTEELREIIFVQDLTSDEENLERILGRVPASP